MQNVHVHEILEMISTSGKAYSISDLQTAVVSQFGEGARFNSCSINDMDTAQAVEFLVDRGKFVPDQSAAPCCGGCGG